MMQYYRIGETLEPLESLPPEEKSILAVLCPEELSGALLPQGWPVPEMRHGTPASERPVLTQPRGIYFAAPCPAASLIALRIMEVTSSIE